MEHESLYYFIWSNELLLLPLLFSYFGKNVWFLFITVFFVSGGKKHFDVFFWRIKLVLFQSKDRKDAAYEGSNGWKGVYFPPKSASSAFVVNMIKVLFPICTFTWHVNNYVSRQKECINRRNESTIDIIKSCNVLYNNFRVLFNLINCSWLEAYFCWKTTFSVALKLIWDTK